MQFFNRVRFLTETTGTGTITIGARFDPTFFLPAEAGAVDTNTPMLLIVQGNDVEISAGTVGGSVTTVARGETAISRIAGVVGTDKIDLDGTAEVSFIESAAQLAAFALSGDLATVAVSGAYSDLTGKPTLGALAAGDDADDVPFTPAGGVAADTVQAAIEELDSEKASSSALAAVATSGAYGDLSGTPTLFPTGTVMLFRQTSAPTGWTKDTSNYNNHALRIVTGTAGSGGSSDFTTVFGKTATDNFTLTSAESAAHSHNTYGNQLTNTQTVGSGGANRITNLTGTGGGNSGSTDTSGGGGAHAHNIDLRVKYVDAIFATKD